tara:strand:+ start:31 stop:474 length:444 start_codon:yes stop_codon:yes gene_type:complete
MRKPIPKPFNSGTLTEAGFRGKIISGLRKASMYWIPKKDALISARKGHLTNPKTGRRCIAGECALCKGLFLEKELKADHIAPVVPLEGHTGETFLNTNWNEYIKRMFVEQDKYQVLCEECHQGKTNEERLTRKNLKKVLALSGARIE